MHDYIRNVAVKQISYCGLIGIMFVGHQNRINRLFLHDFEGGKHG